MTATTNKIDWMTSKGWLKDEERVLLFGLASQLPGNAVILNIGIEYGASLACLRAGNPTARIVGIDLDTSKAVSSYDCSLLEGDSHRIVNVWAEPLDLIFVDGDHGEEGVFLDAGFADWLTIGGHILFQDCFDWDEPALIHKICPGVYAGVGRWFNQPHIQQEFEELPSVETTRVFKRVKEHDSARGITRSSNSHPDIQSGGATQRESTDAGPAPKVQRPGSNPGKRRQR